MQRRASSLFIVVLTALLAATLPARAADYPTRPIKLVVPYAAGGPTDVLGRIVGEYLGRDLKQVVVVENKAGAQGAIGAEAVARSDPDGYTLFVTAASIFVLNPLLYKKLPYDPARDFRLLSVITDAPMIMEVHPSVPARTIAEFVVYAKKNPGKLNFGSAGTGGTVHLAGEMFKQMAGVEMTHVPYKGAGPALQDLLSGNIQLMFDTLGTALPPVKSGMLRPLGVSSTERIPDLPDLPTIAESGYPDYAVSVWYGIAAPSKVPDDVAGKVKASLDRALNDEAFRASLLKIGFPPLRAKSQAEIDTFVNTDRARWAGVVKALNISLD
ncbi:Bug family tripartite tricarboxylate transporter substrate binding protein [Bradyrhizobium elkanii]|uniref:Tripartite-type tricarboxylate transporter receptor subunit TctC n=1 Tax=Bradyrhizobium elkanii TaxID=29448 RepID=A0A8I1YBG2_BRAEL|nr:tripartite tricarboxylate transporter substrate binding protein [Bradyrhizobium elkanii]MBP1296836.1 tripartite-type tricarboxylate transporter receptor subunit TctC [Bradyrhizobium elkanii]MBP2426153.1 tripartite-type tricarboxylate transporter receptor subunit TctC [Bradyrhizobium elkanii]MCP1749371.1 tripartite-type tricarboxylate transporter receptor subunit TctC [Bradyrhizobium elkanii]MCP1983943.1 tripartite-type tricarboxylate transporter receptor subunit TctC [Bradyrhizobium elkanii]